MIQQSNPTQPKPREPRAFLFIGPPGGSKTTVAMQFPNVVFLDCDRNLDGPERFNRTKLKDLAYGYIPITFDDKGAPVPIEKCYDRLIDQLNVLANDPIPMTVVVDSLTMINEFIIRKILNEQRRGEMEARDWIPFKSRMLDLLVGKLRRLGKDTICTVHESKLTEPDPKNMMNKIIVAYEPSVQGSIVDYFGGFFTDMWRFTAEAAPADRVEYNIWCNRTAKSDLKNSLGMPNKIVVKQGEVAYDKLKEWLK